MCAVSWPRRLGLAISLLVFLIPAAAGVESDAFFARRIWTGQGQPIENGVLVIVDGRVSAVGPVASTLIPKAATRHELGSRVIIPGLVVAQTNLADGKADGERTLTPYNSALSGFDFFGDWTGALEGGVTTVQLSPGNKRLMPGTGAVVKLAGPGVEARVLRSVESLRIVLSDESRDPPRIYEPPVGAASVDRPLLPTRPQVGNSLGSAAAGLRAIFRAAKIRTESGYLPEDPVMDAVSSHLSRGGKVRITAKTEAEMGLAFNLAREFSLDVVLVDPTKLEALSVLASGAKLDGVILRGLTPGQFSNVTPEEADSQSQPWEGVRGLIDAGALVAIRPAEDKDLVDFLFVSGQFLQGGLSEEEALQAITRWPAELLGVDDRVGSLTVGKEADFVVLNNDPFALTSHVLSTYVDGIPAYERSKPEDPVTVIQAGAVYASAGRILENGSVVVKGRTVRGIGDVSAPLDAVVRSFPGGVIVPGYIDLGSGLGAGGSLGSSISLETKLGDEIYEDDPAIAVARKGGVTTVLLGASGSAPTPLVAFKLGDEARVVADPVAIRFRLTENLPTTVPTLKMSLTQGRAYHEEWKKYDTEFAAYKARRAAREAARIKDRPEGGSSGREEDEGEDEGEEGGEDEDNGGELEEEDEEPEEPRFQESMEPYDLLFKKKIPAFVEARRSDAIHAALKLFCDEFKLRVILVGVDDFARLPQLLKGYDVTVCAGPSLIVRNDQKRSNVPQLLSNERISFGFQSRSTTGVRDLSSVVQYAVSQGLGPSDALRGLTESPARMLSLESSIGTLEVGRDADLVVLSGPPFEFSTQVLAVMIDGNWAYEKEKADD